MNIRKDGGRIVNEIFNFRTDEYPDSTFQFPELAPCKPTNYPLIPGNDGNYTKYSL